MQEVIAQVFCHIDSLRQFQFPLPKSFTCPQNTLKAGQSDIANRPRFDNGSSALSTPSSTPRSTVVVASQTRLDGPRPDLCLLPYPFITRPMAIDISREPCRDPRRDVNMVVADAILSLLHVVVPVAKFGKAGH